MAEILFILIEVGMLRIASYPSYLFCVRGMGLPSDC
jgi:hypothetical protein